MIPEECGISLSLLFTGEYGSIANMKSRKYMGDSWQNVAIAEVIMGRNNNISDYVTSNTIQLAFRHSIGHSWGSGFAIDDVLVDFQCLDSDNDGIYNNNDEVLGCTNILANNCELATEDDGSCQVDIYGCTYEISITTILGLILMMAAVVTNIYGYTRPYSWQL